MDIELYRMVKKGVVYHKIVKTVANVATLICDRNPNRIAIVLSWQSASSVYVGWSALTDADNGITFAAGSPYLVINLSDYGTMTQSDLYIKTDSVIGISVYESIIQE